MIIDTKNYTVTLQDDTTLGELVDDLKIMLPKGEWKKYTIKNDNHYLIDKIIFQDFTTYKPNLIKTGNVKNDTTFIKTDFTITD